MNIRDKNYYQILEVPSDASGDEIYRGYIQAKNTYSQDSIALYSLLSKKECEEILEVVEEAYGILSDPEKRVRYNEARGIRGEVSEEGEVARAPRLPEEASRAKPPEKEQFTVKGKMTKIVAQKRFSLEFTPNPQFEKEIEKAEVFSGKFLQKIREYKNVDIPRMADMTKVSKTYLWNIEKEDHGNLPALVYVRGFVYQYAKCLKLNPDLVATSYVHRLKGLKESGS